MTDTNKFEFEGEIDIVNYPCFEDSVNYIEVGDVELSKLFLTAFGKRRYWDSFGRCGK